MQNFIKLSQMSLTEKIFSPLCQEIFARQQILNKLAANANLIQPAFQNLNFSAFQAQKQLSLAVASPTVLQTTMLNEKFLKSALAIQNASIDFLSEMKKIDNYQQKTLANIWKEIRLKNNGELELPENFPTKAKKKFKSFFESAKKFLE